MLDNIENTILSDYTLIKNNVISMAIGTDSLSVADKRN